MSIQGKITAGQKTIAAAPSEQHCLEAWEAGYTVINLFEFLAPIFDSQFRKRISGSQADDWSWLDEVRRRMIRAGLHREILGYEKVVVFGAFTPVGRMILYWRHKGVTPEQVEVLPDDHEATLTNRKYQRRKPTPQPAAIKQKPAKVATPPKPRVKQAKVEPGTPQAKKITVGLSGRMASRKAVS